MGGRGVGSQEALKVGFERYLGLTVGLGPVELLCQETQGKDRLVADGGFIGTGRALDSLEGGIFFIGAVDVSQVLDAVGTPDLVLGRVGGHAGKVAGEPVGLPDAEGVEQLVADNVGTVGLVDEPAEGGTFKFVGRRS